jgi:hypothetical protein
MNDFMKVVIDYLEELTGEYVTHINLKIVPSEIEQHEKIDGYNKYYLEQYSYIEYCTSPTKDGIRFMIDRLKQLTIDDLKLIAVNKYGLKEFKFFALTKQDMKNADYCSEEWKFIVEIQNPSDVNTLLNSYRTLVDEKQAQILRMIENNNYKIDKLRNDISLLKKWQKVYQTLLNL